MSPQQWTVRFKDDLKLVQSHPIQCTSEPQYFHHKPNHVLQIAFINMSLMK